MIITYDPIGAVYIKLGDGRVLSTRAIDDNVILDYEHEKVHGIEIISSEELTLKIGTATVIHIKDGRVSLEADVQ